MNVLITQGSLVNLAGSEIITLELAEYFNKLNANVYILTRSYDDPIKTEFEKLNKVQILTDENQVDYKKIDVAWIHHQIIPKGLIDEKLHNKRTKLRIIFHHMSPYHPQEFPLFPEIEMAVADCILYNSYETKQAIEEALPNLTIEGQVFNNPAPDNFYVNGAKKKFPDRVNKIVVVSNHPPKEIEEAVTVFKQKGIKVSLYGRVTGGSHERITPDIINGADIVISIGKTVQYCILASVPVYCYDYYGGPGYLTEANYKKSSLLNFSGRGFYKKSKDNIVIEIIDGYEQAKQEIKLINNVFSSDYSYKHQIEKIEYTNKKTHKPLSTPDITSFNKVSELISLLQTSNYKANKQYIKATEELRNKDAQVHSLEDKNEKMQNTITSLHKSLSWRMTRPLRVMNKILKIDHNEYK